MGNKFSVGSPCSSSTKHTTFDSRRNRSRSTTHIPKHLKPAKPLKKYQRQQLEKQHQQKHNNFQSLDDMIGIALPYQPPTDGNGIAPQQQSPPFAFIQNGSHFTLEQHPTSTKKERDITTINNDGPKNAFQWFQGRRYHLQDDLILPNDQRELDRLRVLNYMLRWAFEGDVVAPVKKTLLEGTHVLHVGCGPGIWLGHPIIDFALDYGRSHFTAVDIMDLLPDQELENNNHGITLSSSEIQSHHQSIDQSYFNFSPLHPMLPTSMSSSTWHQQQQQQRSQPTVNSSGISPSTDGSSTYMTESVSSSSSYSGYYSTLSNSSSKSRTLPCRSPFSNLDIYALDVREYGLPFPDNSFYFVMQRLSTPAYTNQNWKFVVSELIRVTQPGGFIQLVEIDYNSQNLGPAGQAWQDKLCQVMAKTKKLDPHMASHMDIVLEENGLVNVKKKKISMPFGPWGLDIGVLWQQNLEAFIEASAPALGQALGISSEECKAMWQDFKDELVHVKAFTNVYAVWGQKPLV